MTLDSGELGTAFECSHLCSRTPSRVKLPLSYREKLCVSSVLGSEARVPGMRDGREPAYLRMRRILEAALLQS